MSSPWPNVGAQIRKARTASKLSQVDLAKRLGYAERSIQAWERGERLPRLPNLVALADALGQDVAFFYGSDDLPDSGDEVAA